MCEWGNESGTKRGLARELNGCTKKTKEIVYFDWASHLGRADELRFLKYWHSTNWGSVDVSRSQMWYRGANSVE